jgi:hypothetical protein
MQEIAITIIVWEVVRWILVELWYKIVNSENQKTGCTGNNGNGCYMDSCGHNCGCKI